MSEIGSREPRLQPTVSVIIATKDRAHELRTISLPSLAAQNTRDFEVIVWDASSDNSPEMAVHEFGRDQAELRMKYYAAPRSGSASQRNDALQVAKGELVLFIDDDTEISKDAISILAGAFHSDPALGAAALPMTLLPSADAPKSEGEPKNWLLVKYYWPIFGLRPLGFRPKMLNSAAWWDAPRQPGEVDHLSGGCVCFRKSLLVETRFNEKLEQLSPYALYEDVECTHRFWRTGHKMRILEQGYAIHHRASGQRANSQQLYAQCRTYNRYLLWRHAIFPFKKWSLIPFAWSCLGELGLRLIQYCRFPSERSHLLIGTLHGYRTMLIDIVGRS